MTNNIFIPPDEWEHFDFPIEIINLEFEKNLHGLTSSCVIKIWRDEDYKLKASISGYILDPMALEGEREQGPGNFAELDTITGTDLAKIYSYTLTECVIGSSTHQGIYYPGFGLPFVADLHLTSFTKKQALGVDPADEVTIRYDWFLCNHINFFFPGNTARKVKTTHIKSRVGIDPENEGADSVSQGHSRDYFLIDFPDVKCIVAKVPEEFSPSWAKCICIEQRNPFGIIIDRETNESIRNLLGFVMGTDLLHIGSTHRSDDNIILQEAFSPQGNNVKAKCNSPAEPPVQFNHKYNWGKIDVLVNSLLPTYLEKNEKLNLNGILWRYFKAKELTVGVNLPVLSSAIEILATNYLKAQNYSFTYLPQQEYLALIKTEIDNITQKLSNFTDSEKIINKIKSAFNRGANEKLEFFFQTINLPISKIEKEALRARNSMAHGGSDVKTKEEAKELVLKTCVYETLFNRIFLRVLGYNDHYIDYYLPKHPSKKITDPTGPKN